MTRGGDAYSIKEKRLPAHRTLAAAGRLPWQCADIDIRYQAIAQTETVSLAAALSLAHTPGIPAILPNLVLPKLILALSTLGGGSLQEIRNFLTCLFGNFGQSWCTLHIIILIKEGDGSSCTSSATCAPDPV